jgi:uncharacterized protein YjhX (UPF0386 family)
MMLKKDDNKGYHVTLLDRNGDYLGKCRPATARIMKRKGLIDVVSGDPFIVRLKVAFADVKGNIDLNVVSTSK